MQSWEHLMEEWFVRSLVVFFFTNFQKVVKKKILVSYRGSGLAKFKKVSDSKSEKVKDIQKLFKDNHLSITIQYNSKIVNYLEISFNISNATYRSFCKPNDEEVTYILHKKNMFSLRISSVNVTKSAGSWIYTNLSRISKQIWIWPLFNIPKIYK